MLLERTDQLSALADALDAVTARRAGAMVFVGGEAGVGKTALLRAFCISGATSARIPGRCVALLTPGPLGPLFDVAELTAASSRSSSRGDARPHEVTGALVRELAGGRPTVLVLEDLHWADEATLDVLRLLARKVEAVPALVLASYRDDELDRAHPLTFVLGELAHGARGQRLGIPPLSATAVGELAEPHGVEPVDLHRRDQRQPVLRHRGARGGQRARSRPPCATRCSPALARLSAPAHSLLEAIADRDAARRGVAARGAGARRAGTDLEECLASGVVAAGRPTASPSATSWPVSPSRRRCHRIAVSRSIARPRRPSPAGPAAPRTRRASRITPRSPATGRRSCASRRRQRARAASLGAHREAAAQYGRALRYADSLRPGSRPRCSSVVPTRAI